MRSPPVSLLASRRICSLITSSTCGDTNGPRAADVVGNVRERKKARDCEQEQDGRKEREKEVVRQLSRWTENIVLDDLRHVRRASSDHARARNQCTRRRRVTLSPGRRCW